MSPTLDVFASASEPEARGRAGDLLEAVRGAIHLADIPKAQTIEVHSVQELDSSGSGCLVDVDGGDGPLGDLCKNLPFSPTCQSTPKVDAATPCNVSWQGSDPPVVSLCGSICARP